jgi:hypothetical protein
VGRRGIHSEEWFKLVPFGKNWFSSEEKVKIRGKIENLSA